VFPFVVKAGFGFGGEYGEGALPIRGKTVDYYNTVSASVGFQLGAQARSVIILFMTPKALADFRRVYGFKVGVDGSVALITVGVGGSVDTSKIASPIVGFIFDGKGLMYTLTFEGSKITHVSR
jgi:lipid-binding SYLF domain-containing protein